MIVHESVYDEFKARIIEGAKKFPIGEPTNDETRLGPIAREDLRNNLVR